jgi:hypothetical protein
MLRSLCRGLVLASCLLAASATAAETEKADEAPAADTADTAKPKSDDPVAVAFEEFCTSWMGKLAAREVRNATLVEWRDNGSGVEGEYVGYSTEPTCDMKPTPPGGVPVGRINYRELKYRKRGGTKETAGASEPEIVEITEVTEIFRYAKGKWIY